MADEITAPRFRELFKRLPKADKHRVSWAAWKQATAGMQFWRARYEQLAEKHGVPFEPDGVKLTYRGTTSTGGQIFVLEWEEEA